MHPNSMINSRLTPPESAAPNGEMQVTPLIDGVTSPTKNTKRFCEVAPKKDERSQIVRSGSA